MQAAGMLIGGHSHRHEALATLDADAQRDEFADLPLPAGRAAEATAPLAVFRTPTASRSIRTTNPRCLRLKRLASPARFQTLVGSSAAGDDLFGIRRIDAKDVRRRVVDTADTLPLATSTRKATRS